MEVWKDIKGYENLYQVSNKGRIKSLERKVTDKNGRRTRIFKERILKNICASTGYHMVSLHKNNKRIERRTVHRLVMETFDPKENMENLIVDHKDGVRSHNDLSNLRWTDFFTNNRNTPYIRYLQKLLQNNNIQYTGEDVFES